ncbi:PTR2-domain-containing protein [Pseudohyphozyma bogoriensis]|nr:PTR2-domain-containing protein [Pseudohyphozyma bogoriensis]
MSTSSNKRSRSPVGEPTPVASAVPLPSVLFEEETWPEDVHEALWGKPSGSFIEVQQHKGRRYDCLRFKMDWTLRIPHPVLIIEEWKAIYDHIDSHDFLADAKAKNGGLCVGGQPGFGKSTMLRYLLARALNESVPVLFIPGGNEAWLLFTAKGVHKLEDAASKLKKNILPYCEGGKLLALVDLDDDSSFPTALINAPLRIVQAASPKKMQSTATWRKQRGGTVWIVNPWTQKEIDAASPSISTPAEYAEVVGPVPRFIFKRHRDPVAYQAELKAAADIVLASSGIEKLKSVLTGSSVPLDKADRFHQIFMAAESNFRIAMTSYDLHETLDFYAKFVALPQVTGVLFEAAAVKLFAAESIGAFRGFLDIAVVKSSIVARTPFVYPLVQSPASIPLEFDPKSSKSLFYKHQLYVPPAGFATLDAFAWNDDGLYLFQMTIAKKHSLKEAGLKMLIDALPVEIQKLDRHFIFVVPSVTTGLLLVKSALRGTKTSRVIDKFNLKIGYLVLTIASSQLLLKNCGELLKASLEEEDSMEIHCGELLKASLEEEDSMEVDDLGYSPVSTSVPAFVVPFGSGADEDLDGSDGEGNGRFQEPGGYLMLPLEADGMSIDIDDKDPAKGDVVSTFSNDEADTPDGGMPTDDEKTRLRRVAGPVPTMAFLVAFIELAERFSYYGSTVVFTNYIQQPLPPGSTTGAGRGGQSGALGLGQKASTGLSTFNTFWCYSTPLLGAIVADGWLGRFRTISLAVAISMVGHILLTVSGLPSIIKTPDKAIVIFTVAIVIMGLGTGGFKSNISPLVAEQNSETQMKVKTLKTGERVIVDPVLTTGRIFSWFYFFINLGAVTGSVSMVYAEKIWGFWMAFGLPTAIFCICPLILFLARKRYVRNPPSGSALLQALQLFKYASKGRWSSPSKLFAKDLWDEAMPSRVVQREGGKPKWMTWDDEFVGEVRRGLKACQVFLWYPLYWLTVNQLNNNFVSQAALLNTHGLPNDLISNLNPITLIILLPFSEMVFYPALARMKIRLTPIRKISLGFFLGSLAMLGAALLQNEIYKKSACGKHAASCKEMPKDISVAWQVLPIITIAISEILASVTGLNYAFRHAPVSMRSMITAIYLLQNALSGVLSAIFLPLASDPLLVWNFGLISALAAVSGTIFYFSFRPIIELQRTCALPLLCANEASDTARRDPKTNWFEPINPSSDLSGIFALNRDASKAFASAPSCQLGAHVAPTIRITRKGFTDAAALDCRELTALFQSKFPTGLSGVATAIGYWNRKVSTCDTTRAISAKATMRRASQNFIAYLGSFSKHLYLLSELVTGVHNWLSMSQNNAYLSITSIPRRDYILSTMMKIKPELKSAWDPLGTNLDLLQDILFESRGLPPLRTNRRPGGPTRPPEIGELGLAFKELLNTTNGLLRILTMICKLDHGMCLASRFSSSEFSSLKRHWERLGQIIKSFQSQLYSLALTFNEKAVLARILDSETAYDRLQTAFDRPVRPTTPDMPSARPTYNLSSSGSALYGVPPSSIRSASPVSKNVM